jgi:hypothetical protein
MTLLLMILRDPWFGLGLLIGIVSSLAVVVAARDWALGHAAHREHAARLEGRAALVAEQAGAHVHCEPGPPPLTG